MRVNLATLPYFDFTRREFMKTASAAAGAFILGAYLPAWTRAFAQEGGPPQGVYTPNLFLKIDADNSVTLLSKHLDMGQGIVTGLATLVAEELGVEWSQMKVEFAPNDASIYNNLFFGPVQATGGSTSTAEAWDQMRKVGAAARMMFVAAASSKWNVPAGEITVSKGTLSHGSGKRATFGELAVEAMKQAVPAEVPLKPAKDWDLIGTRLPRLDSKGKCTGTTTYTMDIRRPGMLTAVVKRPEHFGATVQSFDDSEARKIEGVVDVVRISRGVAVVAQDTWSAIRGAEALKVNWDKTHAETRSTHEIMGEYRELAKQRGLSALNRGNPAAGIGGSAKTVDLEFSIPYLAHAPMEPLNCVMELHGDSAEIWSGCQLQSIDQIVAAQVLGLKPDQIKIHTLYAGGSFGRRGNPIGDWTLETAEICKATHGRAPIHLVWTRDDDIKGGFYRPMVLHQVKAGVNAQGRIAGWQHNVVSQSIFMGTPFERMAVKDGIDSSMVEGIIDTSYAIPDMAVEVHNAKSPVPVLWWRSVGHSHTGFVMETMIDELAHAAGKDPVALRLELLAGQPRDAAVVRLAAEKAGWERPFPNGHGRGRGFAYHYSFNTRVAMVAEVSTTPETVQVDRIVAAVDCGVAVNPDVVTAQLEGAIGFALSAALRNRITLSDGIVEQRNFDDYEPTRMREMPKVEVHIVKSTERPSGIGEPGVPTVAPAVGNAYFAATGKRLHSLPFDLKTLA
ncbi:MAG TPA: xanthine dehydrogenase family protein molybdopterin-binding subunit [Candidatus Limnocylindrales bacterium]|nr:xanthine dehydrogenase family protein molybdopterin-binding subunit [Candidatus Limnocylindrales bacterium]